MHNFSTISHFMCIQYTFTIQTTWKNTIKALVRHIQLINHQNMSQLFEIIWVLLNFNHFLSEFGPVQSHFVHIYREEIIFC